MNIKRGFFRLWLLFVVLFSVTIFAFSFSDIQNEFQMDSDVRGFEKYSTMVPIERSEARGKENEDYTCDLEKSSSANPFDQFDTCWYELPKFRKLYAEYNDLNDEKLIDELYKKVGKSIKTFSPWSKLLSVLSIAFGIPLIVLIIGSALFWAFEGFKKS